MRLVPADIPDNISGLSDPDSLYEEDSLTFIYHKVSGRIYAGIYPETHNELIKAYELDGKNPRFSSHERLRSEGYIFGRVGYANSWDDENDEEDYAVAISFYPEYDEDDMDVFVSEADALACCKALVSNYKMFDYENCIVIVTDGEGWNYESFRLEGVKGNSNAKRNMDGPECQRLGVDVDGQRMSVAQMLSSLHMVRGQQLDRIKNSFCPQSDQLAKAALADVCPNQVQSIQWLKNHLKCSELGDYQGVLNKAKANYRNHLRDIFRDPERMGREFRTQKELDKAWDYMKQRECTLNFAEWLEEHESA